MEWEPRIAIIEDFHGQECKAGQKCPNHARYVIGYRHMMDRDDENQFKIKWACQYHAEKFCRKHGISFDDLPTLKNEPDAHTLTGWSRMKSGDDMNYMLD